MRKKFKNYPKCRPRNCTLCYMYVYRKRKPHQHVYLGHPFVFLLSTIADHVNKSFCCKQSAHIIHAKECQDCSPRRATTAKHIKKVRLSNIIGPISLWVVWRVKVWSLIIERRSMSFSSTRIDSITKDLV